MEDHSLPEPMRLIGLLLFVLGLSACAGPLSPEIAAERLQTVRKVGVISFAQDTLDVRQASGVLIFTNERFAYPVGSWELQRRTEQILGKALATQARFSVAALDYDAKAIWESYVNDHQLGGFFRVYKFAIYENLDDYMRPIVEGKDLDAVVVIYPGFEGRHCTSESSACIGYGDHGFGLLDRGSVEAYVSLRCDIWDARTFEPISGILINEHQDLVPFKLLPSLDDYEETQRTYIKDGIDYLLETYVPSCLYRTRLLN